MARPRSSILVVGGSGFIGRHLCRRLLALGHRVEAWSRSARDEDRGAERARRVDLVGDAPLPRPREGAWDAVFHVAGNSLPGEVRGVDAVLEAARSTGRLCEHLAEHAPGAQFLLSSSAHVYARSSRPHVETDPVAPETDYGLSKQLAEDWATAYSSRLQVVLVRAFNLIGPGAPKGVLMTDLLDLLRSGDGPLEMQGRDAWRDFLDVRDGVEGFVAAMDAPVESGTVFNLCSGRATRVSELVGCVAASFGAARQVCFADPTPDSLLGSPAKLEAATGWRPRFELDETIAAILEHERG